MSPAPSAALSARARALHEIAALASSLRAEELAARATATLVRSIGMHACLIYLADTPAGVLRCIASTGAPPEAAERLGVVPLDDGSVTGRAALTGEPQRSDRMPPAAAACDPLRLLGGSRFVVAPLRCGGAVLGTLSAVGAGQAAAEEGEVEFFQAVGDLLALALDRARLHAAVAAERMRLTALIDQLPEGVVIAAAPDGRLVLGNRAAEELLGRPVAGELIEDYVPAYRLVTADGRPFPTAHLPLVRALRGETVRGAEVWVERPYGRRPLLVSAAPLRAPDGAISEAVAMFQDITSLKEAERRKDEWLSIASHELRTPMTSLRGYTQFLQRQVERAAGIPDRRTLVESLAVIGQQANRLTDLISDLLDVSRIQQGRLVLRRRQVELGAVVRAAVLRVAETDPSAGERVQLDLPSEGLSGWWDPDRLDQVITNLISNALKYDPRGGTVRLRLRPQDTEVLIEVSDRGIGIPAAEIATLFHPFARAGNVSRRGFGGIGLGLYIARDIIERHGGRIWAESTEGEGTTIRCTLPLTQTAAE